MLLCVDAMCACGCCRAQVVSATSVCVCLVADRVGCFGKGGAGPRRLGVLLGEAGLNGTRTD